MKGGCLALKDIKSLAQKPWESGINLAMDSQVPLTNEQMTNALYSLGVRFLLGGKPDPAPPLPAQLIAALAESPEARLRLALIPLFLEHPEWAVHASRVAARLAPPARLTLQCYYTAAVDFARLYRPHIVPLKGEILSLPDLFSDELGLPGTEESDPAFHLQALAQRHQLMTGQRVNWLGTYHHAVQTWLKGLTLPHP